MQAQIAHSHTVICTFKKVSGVYKAHNGGAEREHREEMKRFQQLATIAMASNKKPQVIEPSEKKNPSRLQCRRQEEICTGLGHTTTGY